MSEERSPRSARPSRGGRGRRSRDREEIVGETPSSSPLYGLSAGGLSCLLKWPSGGLDDQLLRARRAPAARSAAGPERASAEARGVPLGPVFDPTHPSLRTNVERCTVPTVHLPCGVSSLSRAISAVSTLCVSVTVCVCVVNGSGPRVFGCAGSREVCVRRSDASVLCRPPTPRVCL